MNRKAINLFAGIAILAGGLFLGFTPAVAGSCTGPAGERGCTCTSGDGRYTCTGDACTASATGCTFTNFGVAQVEPVEQVEPGHLAQP